MFDFQGSLLVLTSLEQSSGLNIELISDITLEIADEFIVTSKELTIFLLVAWQRFEGLTSVTLLIALEVLGHVITYEAVQEVKLEVILHVKLLALLSLRECVIIVGVTFVSEGVKELLLSLQAEFGQNALLEVDLDALHGILHLHECLRLDAPGSGCALEGIQ